MKHKSSYFHPFVIDQKKKGQTLVSCFCDEDFLLTREQSVVLVFVVLFICTNDLKKWKGEKNPSALPHIDSMSI